jgi:hypothetical protein
MIYPKKNLKITLRIDIGWNAANFNNLFHCGFEISIIETANAA